MEIILKLQERNEIFKDMNSLDLLLNLDIAIIIAKLNNFKDLYYMKL